MTDRITNRHLEQLCRVLNNEVNGEIVEPWTRDESGLHANLGVFYIDGAYGGVALYRMVTDGGGVSDVSGCGHVPKRDLYDRMRGILTGIELARETA